MLYSTVYGTRTRIRGNFEDWCLGRVTYCIRPREASGKKSQENVHAIKACKNNSFPNPCCAMANLICTALTHVLSRGRNNPGSWRLDHMLVTSNFSPISRPMNEKNKKCSLSVFQRMPYRSFHNPQKQQVKFLIQLHSLLSLVTSCRPMGDSNPARTLRSGQSRAADDRPRLGVFSGRMCILHNCA